MGNGRWIRAIPLGYDLQRKPVRVLRQLFDGAGSVGVACCNYYCKAVLPEQVCHFGNGCRLAGAVDSQKYYDKRPCLGIPFCPDFL